jgi:predicted nuclease with TOPRIM domain
MHGKKTLFIILVFVVGLVFGIAAAALFFGIRAGKPGSGESAELKFHLEQVNRDLESALNAQREAAERASRLQAELQGITDHARIIEAGTGRLEAGVGVLADRLSGIIEQSGELADGIDRAVDSIEESRILLGELGTILRGLSPDCATENLAP